MKKEDTTLQAAFAPLKSSGAVVFFASMMPAHGMFEEQPAIAACSSIAARDACFIEADHYGLTKEAVRTLQEDYARLFAAAPALYEAAMLARDVLASIDTVATDGTQAKLNAALALVTAPSEGTK